MIDTLMSGILASIPMVIIIAITFGVSILSPKNKIIPDRVISSKINRKCLIITALLLITLDTIILLVTYGISNTNSNAVALGTAYFSIALQPINLICAVVIYIVSFGHISKNKCEINASDA